MRAVIQKVSGASVTIQQRITAQITSGLLILVGVEDADNEQDVQWLSHKIVHLRIFHDNDQVPNLSVKDVNGEILLVSQFTLFASTKKGNRPSYIKASKGEVAREIYEKLATQLADDLGKTILTGEFGANMQVRLINDGPFTVIIDTKIRE